MTSASNIEYFWPAITTETCYGGPFPTEGNCKYREANDPEIAQILAEAKAKYKAEQEGHWAEISTVLFRGIPVD